MQSYKFMLASYSSTKGFPLWAVTIYLQ